MSRDLAAVSGCDHPAGRCSGALRLAHGQLVRAIRCDDCGVTTHELDRTPYGVAPVLNRAA